MRQRK